ncbi:hypothetical protein [Massilia sp. erpn]|uniref:hypothetical protein n=1 Tax=Massilia sp. erpn TaxID=2738142 RepID=UPI0021043B4C|nr:hypothetical protein [Massilia sp. erpn]UTY59468.1 hypothetical protein HPQ68_21195 [Massilia sp. erpn]
MKKVIVRLFILLSFSLASVSASALGVVSRSCAAAGAQESISVDWGFKNYLLWTASEHYRNGVKLHAINTVKVDANGKPISNGWEMTWRSYAGHLASEFWYGTVVGHHYKSDSGLISFLGNSTATDCNLGEWGGS